MRYDQPCTQIDIGDTHATVREPGGRIRTAIVLEKRVDADGRITSVLLDRVVHEKHGRIDGWTAGGCFVTELVPTFAIYIPTGGKS
jgi:hypothetical protein